MKSIKIYNLREWNNGLRGVGRKKGEKKKIRKYNK